MRLVQGPAGVLGTEADHEGILDDAAEHVAAEQECQAAEHLPLGHRRAGREHCPDPAGQVLVSHPVRHTARADSVTARPRLDARQRQVLDRFTDAWQRCDIEALAALLREDVVLSMPPELTAITGRAEVTSHWHLGTIGRGRGAPVPGGDQDDEHGSAV
jgi:hypothetical protein